MASVFGSLMRRVVYSRIDEESRKNAVSRATISKKVYFIIDAPAARPYFLRMANNLSPEKQTAVVHALGKATRFAPLSG
jgi:hypothetical protein